MAIQFLGYGLGWRRVACNNDNISTIDDRVEKTKLFDVIIDKGLLDALLWGDGFDIQRFMSGINDTLIPNNWGLQILICFPLSESLEQIKFGLGFWYSEWRTKKWSGYV